MACRLRVQEALALAEPISIGAGSALLVRRGKGGRRREVGMDAWGWDELDPWLELPVGRLLCASTGGGGRLLMPVPEVLEYRHRPRAKGFDAR